MTLNEEFKSLYQRWWEKANQYDTENVHQLFDKFFSLYVVYNALYVEAAAHLKRKAISKGKDAYKVNDDRFPDEAAATKYVLDIIGSKSLLDMLKNNNKTKAAIEQLKMVIDEENYIHFWICLDPIWGEPQPEKDKEILKLLKSSSSDEQARAILTVIYQVRCNMFHGRKGVDPVQRELLLPIITILEQVTARLYEKLEREFRLKA